VKFFLAPLLIIGMCVTFSAAMVVMLFATGKIRTVEELEALVRGPLPGGAAVDAAQEPEDALQRLAETVNDYRQRYEGAFDSLKTAQDSLSAAATRLSAREEKLLQRERELESISDSTYRQQRQVRIKELAKYYGKIKAASAAEILQQETELSDTTVALLMQNLQPNQMGKIMAAMNADYAARITKLMQQF
jgi:flagellar motility protein MotE (MotC chaperone)